MLAVQQLPDHPRSHRRAAAVPAGAAVHGEPAGRCSPRRRSPYAVDPRGGTGTAADPCSGTRVTSRHRRRAGRRRRHLPDHRQRVPGRRRRRLRGAAIRSNRAVSGLDVDAFAQYLSANRPISAPATDRTERPWRPGRLGTPSRYSLGAQNERKRDLRNKVPQAPLSSPPRRGGVYAANDRRSPREGYDRSSDDNGSAILGAAREEGSLPLPLCRGDCRGGARHHRRPGRSRRR